MSMREHKLRDHRGILWERGKLGIFRHQDRGDRR